MASLAGWLRVTAAAISFPAAWSALARKMPPTRDALATGKRPHLEPVHIPNDLGSQAPLVTRAFGQGLYTPRSGRALFFLLRQIKNALVECAILIVGSRAGLPASSARAGRSRQLPVKEGRSTR